MLDKIIHFSLHNRLLILVASVLLLIGGTYTAFHTEVDVFPDLNAPTVVVMTEAGGMAAEEVEQLVTFPIETAVNGATGVRRVRSSSTTGFSVVWVEFDWDTDVYLARQIVSEKLAAASEDFPANVGKPTLGPQSSILGELLIVGFDARPPYFGRLDYSSATSFYGWCSSSCRAWRRYKGISDIASPGTHEILWRYAERSNGLYPWYESEYQRRCDIRVWQ